MNHQFSYTATSPHTLPGRWSTDRIHEWYAGQPWPVGCNYIPQYAINQLEMWDSNLFDETIISKELGWAANLGFNAIRVFLHHLPWQNDQHEYLHHISRFLDIADRYNIKVMFVFFDSVWDPYPQPGPQKQPKPNVHNSGWVQCPGFQVLNDPSSHDSLFSYVHDIVSHFKHDKRVLAWDLFNEPDNTNLASYKDDHYTDDKGVHALQLLKKAVNWVRSVNPIQPITMAPWQHDWSSEALLTPLDAFMLHNSDIISFHCYEEAQGMEKRISDLQRFARPILCTEYMARPLNSTFQNILPLLRQHQVGAFNWGFVAGKSQTHCPWESWTQSNAAEPEVWFHDIFRQDGVPYDEGEIEYLKTLTREQGNFAPGDN